MSQEQITTAITKLQNIFDTQYIDNLGKETRFCKKLRKFTPGKLALSLIAAFSSNNINNISDLHRTFNEIIQEDSEYKPFHNQLSKKEFPKFMISVLSYFLSELNITPVTISKSSPLHRFKKILCHDGSSIALKSGLKEIYPGRFTKTAPAAIELHVTMDLLSGQPEQIILTEDTASERHQLFPIEEQKDSLALYDRGYCDKKLFKIYNEQGASFIIKGKKSLKPIIKKAYINGTKHLKKLTSTTIDFKKKLPKKDIIDCDIFWKNPSKDQSIPQVYRMIFWWNASCKEYVILITNLSREEFSPFDITQAYRLRWQIELLFKEWKSFNELKKFDTNNEFIATGLIWSAITASVVKRYLSGVAQLHYNVWMSTFKVAKCVGNKLINILDKILFGSKSDIENSITDSFEFLFKNAKRSHPKRDLKKSGWSLGFIFCTNSKF